MDTLDIRKRIPPSSSPHKIYSAYLDDINGGDLHSDKIKNNINGLKRGAIAKLAEGAIDDDEFAKINYLIDHARIEDFRPLLYVIPRNVVETKIQKVKVDQQANPLSEEYLIVDLKTHECDIIEIK